MSTALLGKPVAEAILERTRRVVETTSSPADTPPGLVSVHRSADTAFAVYLERQKKTAARALVSFRDVALPPSGGAEALRQTVRGLDAERSVDAVLVEHPLPGELDFLGGVSLLRPEKDVDGVGPVNLGRLVAQRPIQAPAVALGALAILAHYDIPLRGRRVTVIGRSPTVGLPLALLLLSRRAGGDATVTIAHTATSSLTDALDGSEVIFSCAGKPGLLTRAVVPKGAVVVDIGLTNRGAAVATGESRTVGDADAKDLDGWAEALTPVPGGVGPVTVARLMANTVRAWSLLRGRSPDL